MTREEYDIVLVLPYLGPGGAQRVAGHLANAWSNEGRRVCAITTHSKPQDAYRLDHAPARISLLRLDTVYASTLREFVTLCPLLSRLGILVVDDSRTWAGGAQTTKEYFEQNNVTMLLNRLDPGSRIGVKVEPAEWQRRSGTGA